jgi:hypothetical protein
MDMAARRKKTIKAVIVPSLSEQMAAKFRDELAKQLTDERRKQFYVALMLAMPSLTTYEMDRMEPVLVEHIGEQRLKTATEEAR